MKEEQVIQRITENQVHKFRGQCKLRESEAITAYIVGLNLKINENKINSEPGTTLRTEKYNKERHSGFYPLD